MQVFYGGIDEDNLIAHMKTVFTSTQWLIPFQALRGVLREVLSLPIICIVKGHCQVTAFAVGLMFAVLMNSQFFLPTPRCLRQYE
jgi:hypothetical protein